MLALRVPPMIKPAPRGARFRPSSPFAVEGARGVRLHGETSAPPGAARAHVVLVHGFAEHRGRYAPLAEALVGAGFAVHRFDLRGHGDSGGPRGEVERFADYRADLGRVIADRIADGADYCLVAHSLGGLVALDWLLDGDAPAAAHPPAALVLSSPFLAAALAVPPFAATIAQVGSLLFPRLSFDSGIEPEALSRDPEVVRAYRDDPKVFERVSVRWYAEALEAQERVVESAERLRVPCLLLLGTADGIADRRRAEAFFARAGSRSKRLRVYPDFRHEVFNEVGREEVLGDLLAWLDEVLGSAAASGSGD